MIKLSTELPEAVRPWLRAHSTGSPESSGSGDIAASRRVAARAQPPPAGKRPLSDVGSCHTSIPRSAQVQAAQVKRSAALRRPLLSPRFVVDGQSHCGVTNPSLSSLNRLIQGEAAVRALYVDQWEPLPSPATGLQLCDQSQSLPAAWTVYSRNDDQIAEKDNSQRRERPPAKTSRHRQDGRQPDHEPNRLGNATNVGVSILKFSAQCFHGARFYSLRRPTQCI
jgi:hypothetical protein